LNYIADSTGNLFLCYNWELEPKASSDIWEIFVDINSGSVIQKINRKLSCSFSPFDAQKSCVDWDQNKQYTSFNPWSTIQSSSLIEAQYQVYALPIENPNHGLRTMETDGQDTTASPLGWQSTETGIQFNITKGE
jgi:extracellular elastinolytic metalloproteinase